MFVFSVFNELEGLDATTEVTANNPAEALRVYMENVTGDLDTYQDMALERGHGSLVRCGTLYEQGMYMGWVDLIPDTVKYLPLQLRNLVMTKGLVLDWEDNPGGVMMQAAGFSASASDDMIRDFVHGNAHAFRTPHDMAKAVSYWLEARDVAAAGWKLLAETASVWTGQQLTRVDGLPNGYAMQEYMDACNMVDGLVHQLGVGTQFHHERTCPLAVQARKTFDVLRRTLNGELSESEMVGDRYDDPATRTPLPLHPRQHTAL